ncbi:hypothetical protein [Paracoccus sp. PAR01]|uniref:hypothetical protein n=1 Tax=Paracoccus sp. PAR01 TaxID=2769282 RepID=UPI00177F3C18|nr:hypothetical protein [Paracoccus sp. PAR01]MBD9528987.1 hypothetical protein [Paracoccus sp. PAR01]
MFIGLGIGVGMTPLIGGGASALDALLRPGSAMMEMLWPDPQYWFTDVAATTRVTAEGQPIRCWLSTTGARFVQATDVARAPLAVKFPNGAWGASFDGVNDALLSEAALDLSAIAQIAVFAGVRKLSDAANGVLIEHSTNATNITGFNIFAPVDGTPDTTYRWAVRTTGGVAVNIGTTDPIFAAPDTSVIAATVDGAAQTAALRVDQVSVGTSNVVPVGTFASQTLHIGARAGTSNLFNGLVGPLIVRGGALPVLDTIQQAEAIINAHIGAY